jgi:hypothetical protein
MSYFTYYALNSVISMTKFKNEVDNRLNKFQFIWDSELPIIFMVDKNSADKFCENLCTYMRG